MPTEHGQTVTVGVTGASGALLAQKTLALLEADSRIARIHLVVTETGHEVLTRFPAEKLMVAGTQYFTTTGPLETTREHDPEPSRNVLEMIEASARMEGVGTGD